MKAPLGLSQLPTTALSTQEEHNNYNHKHHHTSKDTPGDPLGFFLLSLDLCNLRLQIFRVVLMVSVDAVEGVYLAGGAVGGLFDADGVFAGSNADGFPRFEVIFNS